MMWISFSSSHSLIYMVEIYVKDQDDKTVHPKFDVTLAL